MLNGFEGVDSYIEWRDKNTWTTKKKDLYLKMTESEEYKQCKKEYQRELDTFNKKIVKNRTRRYLITIGIVIVILACLCIPAYVVNLGKVSSVIKSISEKIAFPILLSVITTYIILDFKKKEEDN